MSILVTDDMSVLPGLGANHFYTNIYWTFDTFADSRRLSYHIFKYICYNTAPWVILSISVSVEQWKQVCFHRFQMAAIYNLLVGFRLQKYHKGFLDKGVTDERDFIDSVTDEDLQEMGKTRCKILNANIHKTRQSGLVIFLKAIKSTQKHFSNLFSQMS